METFHISVKAMEDEVGTGILNVKTDIIRWISDLRKFCL